MDIPPFIADVMYICPIQTSIDTPSPIAMFEHRKGSHGLQKKNRNHPYFIGKTQKHGFLSMFGENQFIDSIDYHIWWLNNIQSTVFTW